MNFRRRVLALTMSGGLLGVVAPLGGAIAQPMTVQAYNLFGCQWAKNPLGRTQVYYFLYDGHGSTYGNNWAAAANSWNATNAHAYFTDDTAGIQPFEVIANDGNFGNAGYDGITYFNGCVSNQTIESEEVFLNRYYTDGYSADGKLQVATHELGHTLGLAHNNVNPCDPGIPIMYYTSDRFFKCGIKTPQSDDMAGVNAMY